jgi:hypothetical protein
MRRIASSLAVVGLAASLAVGVSAQPAFALGRCGPLGSTHSHLHSAHGHFHIWKVVEIDPAGGGRHVYRSTMTVDPRVNIHTDVDVAIC